MKDISLHILDIANNSVSAAATLVEICVDEQPSTRKLAVAIKDNGRGMSPDIVERIIDPFYTTRTTRKVGMGIPLIKQNAEQTGGTLKIESAEGFGTTVQAVFNTNHIDCPPLGNIAEIMTILITGNPKIDFLYTHKIGELEFSVDSRQIKEILEEVPINSPPVVRYIREMIMENIQEINQSNSNQ